MKITKLHLIIIVILISGFFAGKNMYKQFEIAKQQKELERIRQQEFEKSLQEAAEKQKKEKEETELVEKKKLLANEAIAVAGEYWKIAKKECRDVRAGQLTLKTAKENFAAQDYSRAWELAHLAIKELKAADRRYSVKSGDNLWRIAAMKRHFGKGRMWPYIWMANRGKIKNPRLIYPKQNFFIPVESWEKYKDDVAKIQSRKNNPSKKLK